MKQSGVRQVKQRVARKAASAGLLALVISGLPSALAGAQPPPFNQCPPTGADTSCAILITINPDGSQTVQADNSQGPYGGPSDTEDTLVGVQNNSSVNVGSLAISSSTDAFGFDGDGPCTFNPAPAGCSNGVYSGNAADTTGYGGPDNHFANISSDAHSGTVVFDGGLPPGGSRYWAFDEKLTPSQITPPNPGPGPNPPPSNQCQSTAKVRRLSGTDRIGTAIAISNCYGPGGAQAVVLARSDTFPDSLAGSPLATRLKAPMLLTPSTSLDGRTSAEIQRVLTQGSTVFLLGGTVALTPGVEQSVRDLGYNTVRYGGANRFGTAVIIAHSGLGDPGTLFEATGLQFADALIASSAAARVSGAILLTADSTMPQETRNYINNVNRGNQRYAIGQPASRADPSASPIFGADQYQTSQLVAQQFFPSPPAIGVASGANFPDALAGSAQMGGLGGPLLLSQPDQLPPGISNYLAQRRGSIGSGYIYGGPAALADQVQTDVQNALG